uniref:HMA domain-containing protein n=1 Tax=Kalanchoe fedtschenkoi TaxID=63787 RepID=A0A7N0TFE4_KALFE
MGKLSIGGILDRFCISSDLRSSCFCIGDGQREEFELERDRLIEESEDGGKQQQLVCAAKQTLAFQLKPKMVVLRVSMHCHGCAKKVQKHISKMEGVTSYEVDMERKMVVIFGDIVPYEVLESVSKVKNAEFWSSPSKS